MKRQLLAVAIAAATLLPLTAQAAPTVYGRLNLSVDYTDSDDATNNAKDGIWELNSNSSRIGVKGNEKLTEEFTAVYKAEWGVQGDATAGDLNARERYLGLKHYQWGTVRLGNIDSPLKNAEDDIDVFNDNTILDMDNYATGQMRLENSINYVSPKFLDVFGVNLTLQPSEGASNENHIADAISTALSYEDDNLYLSFAMDKDVTTKLPELVVEVANEVAKLVGNVPVAATSYSEKRDTMRFNARYKLNDLTISTMFQQSEASNNLNTIAAKMDEELLMLSGSYKMDAVTVRGQFSMVNFDAGKNFIGTSSDEMDTTLIGVGIDYNFTQATKAYVNLANIKSEVKIGGVSDDADATYLGFGMETRF
ncbi:MAG TPA: porin [Agitococcus sp.]|nr:porin [Agitococcus sp.]